jgi:hypothetical protein
MYEGEGNAQMNTPTPLKKSSSQERRLSKSDQNVLELLEKNAWNPFVRVNPKLLERLHRKQKKAAECEAAPF